MNYRLCYVPDSFVIFPKMPEGCFDVTITDPPYDEHTQANQISGTAMRKHVEGGSGAVPKVELPFAPLTGYERTTDLVRGTKRWTVVFCSVEAFGDLRRVHGTDVYRRGAWWYKPNAQGQMSGDRPAIAGEGIACLHRPGRPAWNGRGSYGFWPCNGTRGEKGRHPNQKPLDLCLKLVALFSNRGEEIFDPFVGSGRIGEAALLLGRRYFGLDQSPEWIEKANARLDSVAFGSVSDEHALSLCTARRSEILES
jgi:hypothetical protein